MPRAKKERFEVWGLVDEGWALAQTFASLDEADSYIKGSLRGAEGVRKGRIVDTNGELAQREYNCQVAS